jgi:hypothetical protein
MDPSTNAVNEFDINQLNVAMPAAAAGRGSMDSDSSMDVLQALFASEPPPDARIPNPAHSEHTRRGFHPHLPHFHPHLPHLHLHMPNLKHLPWFLRRHLEKEAEAAAQADVEAGTITPTPVAPASPAATPASFTNAFTGVPADAMPSWLDDAADDVVSPAALAAAQAQQAHVADADALDRALARVETEEQERARDKEREKERRDEKRLSRESPRGSLPTPPPAAVLNQALAGLGQGVAAVMGPSVGLSMGMGTRRGSQSSHFSGSSSTRASFSASVAGSAASPGVRGSFRSARPRWAAGVRRGSLGEPHTPLHLADPRARRQATLALAEKLYEEMEAQL